MISDKALARASLAIAQVYRPENMESEARWIASIIRLCIDDDALEQKISTGSTPALEEEHDL